MDWLSVVQNMGRTPSPSRTQRVAVPVANGLVYAPQHPSSVQVTGQPGLPQSVMIVGAHPLEEHLVQALTDVHRMLLDHTVSLAEHVGELERRRKRAKKRDEGARRLAKARPSSEPVRRSRRPVEVVVDDEETDELEAAERFAENLIRMTAIRNVVGEKAGEEAAEEFDHYFRKRLQKGFNNGRSSFSPTRHFPGPGGR